jgi:hypothetical protein
VVINGAGFMFRAGRVSLMDIFLAGVIVFTHGVYVRRAGEWLDKQR